MSKQSEALRLAVYLEGFYVSEDVHATTAREIAAELRRLHALNGELLEALRHIARAKSTSLALEYVQGIARAAIAKAGEQP